MPELIGFLGGILAVSAVFVPVACLVLNFLLALKVLDDAKRNEDRALRITPGLWFFAALVLPLGVGAFGYWLMHYSKVAPRV